MDKFYQDLFSLALTRGDLDPDNDPEYCAACDKLNALLDGLSEPLRDSLSAAIYHLADCSDTVALAYGFRLGAQILATPEARAASATAFATAGHTRSSNAAGTM